MCGICGIHGSTDLNRVGDQLSRMTEKLKHRGPDASGNFIEENIALGHTRLSIIDLSRSADQPMSDVSGRYTLVFNGEIYNFQQLKKMLKDYPFKTKSDSEVFLAGLVKWGLSFLNQCEGMYAFAFWDKEKNELVLGRDRLGIKPLYYARRGNTTYFASEIRSILASGDIGAQLNQDVLGEYIRYQTVHGTDTVLTGVYSLPAGSTMTISDNEFEIKTYWNLITSVEPAVSALDYDNLKDLVKERLNKAVSKRLVSDVPIGVFLSGGIDSSALVALAASQSSDNLKTFNINFAEGEFSEAQFAKIVADKFGTDHTQIDLDPHILIDKLPEALASMDHPSGDGINSYVVSEAAKSAGITVALSGLGGDEIFAGYPIFSQFASLSDKGWLLSFPKFFRSVLGRTYSAISPGIKSKKISQVITEDYLDIEYVFQYSREVQSKEQIEELLDIDAGGMNKVFQIVNNGVGVNSPGFLMNRMSKVSFAELSTYLQSVLLRDTDQMSMAHALEVRVPFLDHDLVSLLMSIPDKYKFGPFPKNLLVDSLAEELPREVYDRPKMGFTFPWKYWMKNDLKEFCGDSIVDLSRRKEFNSSKVSSLWDRFLADDNSISWSRIWYLCVLQSWMNQNNIG